MGEARRALRERRGGAARCAWEQGVPATVRAPIVAGRAYIAFLTRRERRSGRREWRAFRGLNGVPMARTLFGEDEVGRSTEIYVSGIFNKFDDLSVQPP